MATKKLTINQFNGGISNDERSKDLSKHALASHFDTWTFLHKLVPRDGTEDIETSATDIVKFLYADKSGTQVLWGFDRNASGRCLVRYLSGTTWTGVANNEASSDVRNEDVFFHYKGFIYMWGGGKLKRFDTTSAAAFDDAYQTIAFTTVVQPVHHPSDDIAYFPADNAVHTLNGVTWASDALVLPTNEKIVSACAYGNYLAIATTTKKTLVQGVKSTVYLWDRDSSLTTLTERIDFGSGKIKHIANLDNRLVAVMETIDDRQITIKVQNGKFAVALNKLDIGDQQLFPTTFQVVDNRLYFPAALPVSSSVNRLGIWAIDSNGKLELDFTHTTATSYEGIYWTGDVWWLAHSNSTVSRSTTSASGSSVYETLILGDSFQNKKLISVGVMTEPLASNLRKIDLKYRIQGESSWTTIFANKGERYIVFHEAINIEASGANLPQFREIEFQVTVNNSSISLTGLSLIYEEINDNLV